MARVVSGVLIPTTTTAGQNIASFTPDTGTVLIAMQCSGWLRTWSQTAARLGVVGLYEDNEPKFECTIQGSPDYGQGGVIVLPMEKLEVASGGSNYVWAFVPWAVQNITPNLVAANTFWHGAFMFE